MINIMINTITVFFSTFIHPTRTSSSGERSQFLEVLGVSWALHLLNVIYSIAAIWLGIMSYEYLSTSKDFTHMLFQSLNIKYQKFSMMSLLLQVIFYPFIFQFAHKFWIFLIKFYASIFDYNENTEHHEDDLIEDVVTTSFTVNLLLIIPIFGSVLSIIAQGLYLFTGLKTKLSFTNTQAFLVLITPLFILFLLGILIASYFVLLISMF